MALQIIQDSREFRYDRLEMKDQLLEVRDFIKSLVVNDESSFDTVTSIYKMSKSWEKQIEFSRKIANEPDQAKINARNDMAKALMTPLKEIQEIAKNKTVAHQATLEEKQRQEQAKLKEAAELIGIEDVSLCAPLEKSIRGHGAIAYTRVVRKFRITDLSKVPVRYLQINEDAVKEAIDMGIDEIPGLEIFESKEIQLKVR